MGSEPAGLEDCKIKVFPPHFGRSEWLFFLIDTPAHTLHSGELVRPNAASLASSCYKLSIDYRRSVDTLSHALCLLGVLAVAVGGVSDLGEALEAATGGREA
jgi:hypothetical protein